MASLDNKDKLFATKFTFEAKLFRRKKRVLLVVRGKVLLLFKGRSTVIILELS